MTITPEMARAELQRRKSLSSSITPEMAKQELMRRKSLMKEPDREEKVEEGSEEPKFEKTKTRAFARGARNSVAGIADMADFVATPVREGMNLLAKPFGMHFPAAGEEIAKGIDTATGGYTRPQDADERVEERVGRDVTSMVPGVGLGMAAKGLRYAPKLVEATGKFLSGSNKLNARNIAGTAATSGLIQEHLNENPEDTLGAMGKGFLVPIAQTLAGIATKKGRTKIGGKIGESINLKPEAVETFKEAGITPTLPDVSGGKIPKLISSKLEHTPFASAPIVNAKALQKNQILEGLGQGEIGKNLSKSEAGELVIKGAKGRQKAQEKNFGNMFSKVEEDIEKLADRDVEIDNVNKYFEGIVKKIKTPSQERRFKQSPLGKMYVDLYESAKQNGGKLPYEDMKDRLDHINDLITTHGEIGKVSQGKMKQFASNIAKDIETSMEPKMKELGDKSYKNWTEAKKYYSEYAQNEIPKLNELYKKDKKGATDAFVDLVTNQKKGAEKAKLVLQGLDKKDQIELTDAIHKQLGRSSDGSFSPLKWVRGYKDLDSDAQKILLSPLNPATQKKFGAIADSIDHLKSTLGEANTSKTAYHTALVGLAAGGTKALGSLATGNPIPIGSLATGLFLGNRVSEKILTNPKFINWMYKGMKAKDLGRFEKNLEDIPHVGKYRKTLAREIQTFQHDLDDAKKDKKVK